MNYKKQCPFCKNKKLYAVSNTSLKCSACKRKYSHIKLEKDYKILNFFCDNISANECAKSLKISYKSVRDRYMDFRKFLYIYIENIYIENYAEFNEHDEYYFLPQNKRGRVKYLFEAIGILGMAYNNSIYTLLLPDQFAHIKNRLDNEKIIYIKEYARFLNRHKIMHFEKFDSRLIRFWVYLEEKLLHFKGVSKENFIYYLKEYEFKFNHKKEKQKKILWQLWIEFKMQELQPLQV